MLYLGRRDTQADYLKALLDEITIFNRALAPAEIQQLFNTTRGPQAAELHNGCFSRFEDEGMHSSNEVQILRHGRRPREGKLSTKLSTKV